MLQVIIVAVVNSNGKIVTVQVYSLLDGGSDDGNGYDYYNDDDDDDDAVLVSVMFLLVLLCIFFSIVKTSLTLIFMFSLTFYCAYNIINNIKSHYNK